MNPRGTDPSADTSSASPQHVTFDALNTGSLDTDIQSTQAIIDSEEAAANAQLRAQAARRNRIRLIRFVSLLVLIVIGLALVWWRHGADTTNTASVSQADASQRYDSTTIPLTTISDDSSALSVGSAQTLSVNGQLNVNNSLVITPTTRPDGAVTGQLYYDQTTNKLAYYNGSSFVNILSGSLPVEPPATTFNGTSGAFTTGTGITLNNEQLSNSGVLSLQGETGNVTLAAGPGIVVDGTTLSNTGLLSLGGATGNISLGTGLSLTGNTLNAASGVHSISGSGNIAVIDNGNGNYTITTAGQPGTGTVTSPGGTTGQLAMFDGVQDVADSIISQSGSLITIGGDLQVNGNFSLSTPLGVTSGGTGANNAAAARTNLGAAQSGANGDITSLSGLTTALSVAQGGTGIGTLPTNSVLIGNGTSAISGITGTNGQCLVINSSGAPVFGTCGGAGGVSSLNTLNGAISIANASIAGQTITLNDAKADGATKGIATFSGNNFSDNGGGVISIKTGGVGSGEIADQSVTGTDLALSTITNANLASGSYGAITSANNLTSATSLVTVGTLTAGAINWGVISRLPAP